MAKGPGSTLSNGPRTKRKIASIPRQTSALRRRPQGVAQARVQHPEVAVEFSLDNGFRNIGEEGFDAGIRLGGSLAADMIAARGAPDWRLGRVAAPDYRARRGRPSRPEDLIGQDWINHRHTGFGGLYAWEFVKGAETLRVRVTGRLTFTLSLPMVTAAVVGPGWHCRAPQPRVRRPPAGSPAR